MKKEVQTISLWLVVSYFDHTKPTSPTVAFAEYGIHLFQRTISCFRIEEINFRPLAVLAFTTDFYVRIPPGALTNRHDEGVAEVPGQPNIDLSQKRNLHDSKDNVGLVTN